MRMAGFVLIVLLCDLVIEFSKAQLQIGFYSKTCPDAESIVRGFVQDATRSDPRTPAFMLRLHFHDCFVEGCDGSILIDEDDVKVPKPEKGANGHQGVQGWNVVDIAKAKLESVCPGVVSCADIVAMAARDGVALSNGPNYEVETGRNDGLVSVEKLADGMPDVRDSIQILKQKFFEKGLDERDLVLLSAAHTIGTAACFFMGNRLYNFAPGATSDPRINPSFLPELRSMCPKNGDINNRLPMDRGSEMKFDTQILQNIRSGFAVLQSDAQLMDDPTTKELIDSYLGASRTSFEQDFVNSMAKMGRLESSNGSKGNIRRVCRAFN